MNNIPKSLNVGGQTISVNIKDRIESDKLGECCLAEARIDIAKTFNGMYVQKAILASLAERKGTTYRLATPEEESVGIDGYVGNVPYSVKPDTYKTMGRLSETIAVKMIYYTKTKTGLTIEIED